MKFEERDADRVKEYLKYCGVNDLNEKERVLTMLVKLLWARGDGSERARDMLKQDCFVSFEWSDQDFCLAQSFCDWLDDNE